MISKSIYICIVCWSLCSIFNKLALERLHPLSVQIISCCVGFITAPIYFYFLRTNNPNAKWDAKGIVYILIVNTLSILSSLIFLNLLKKYPAGSITVYVSSYPALTVLISVLFFNEQITIQKFFGIIIVLFGLVLLGNSK